MKCIRKICLLLPFAAVFMGMFLLSTTASASEETPLTATSVTKHLYLQQKLLNPDGKKLTEEENIFRQMMDTSLVLFL